MHSGEEKRLDAHFFLPLFLPELRFLISLYFLACIDEHIFLRTWTSIKSKDQRNETSLKECRFLYCDCALESQVLAMVQISTTWEEHLFAHSLIKSVRNG